MGLGEHRGVEGKKSGSMVTIEGLKVIKVGLWSQ